MAATAGVATPFQVYRVMNSQGAQAAMRRFAEKASQTFLIGTPVQVDVAGGTGYIIACPSMTSVATAIIAGIAAEAGHNLTTAGVGKTLTQGSPVNQSSAVIIPGGAWPSDGTVGLHTAADINEFVGVLGGSNTDADGTSAITQLSTLMGLTKDATTGYWYVDADKTAGSTGACVEITGFVDPLGTLHGRVIFRVTHAACQLVT